MTSDTSHTLTPRITYNAQSMCCFNATIIYTHIKTANWTIYLAHKLMPIAVLYGLKHDLLGIHNFWEKCQPVTAICDELRIWLLGE